ncbi:MAG: murein DD-endopeptidase MepM/ murein hydrolase activator NlpD [Myxococcota bacterium]|jgi:murein DD-endopeptidase MepM/ murein hydrolase activator NlpD
MHPYPSPIGQRQKTSRRNCSRPNPMVVGLTGVLLVAGFATGLEANEVDSVRRSGTPGQFEPVAIESLPLHRPMAETQTHASLDRTALDPPPSRLRTTHSKAPGLTNTHVAPFGPQGLRVIKGKIASGQSISSVLGAQGISPRMVRMIDHRMRPKFDFRNAQPGDTFRMSLDSDGELVSFRYRNEPDEGVVLRQSADGYEVAREHFTLKRKLTRMRGTVKSSLYQAVKNLGHDPGLASVFAEIFAWDIDFSRQLKSGDSFSILYEKLYREEEGEEVFVRSGQILAAQFKGKAAELTAVYFEERNGNGGYYRPDGDTIEQEYLVAPLKFSRISSHYSAARNHPILKVVRPHHGIDYAARSGTPLWSVADGTVIFKGVNGGFGNLVKIRHGDGYVSYYAHMSRFTPNLKVGQKVLQHEVIGFVGQTGLATGPHVCFRVTKYGKYVNPTSLNHGKPVTRSVADASWAEFELVRDQLLGNLRDGARAEFAGNAL